MSGNSDLHDLLLSLHAETKLAILVSDDGDEKHAQWLPKSQIEYVVKRPGVVEVTAPSWLLENKGLL